jgi:hypothetical protein
MNYKSLKMLGVLAGFALGGMLTAHAQDKATLDLLVQKGLITQADEDNLVKANATVPVTAKVSAVQKFTLEGLLQFDYDDLAANAKGNLANPPATNQMYFRRAELGVKADLGNGWGGELVMDFAATQVADQPKSGLSPQSAPATASPTGGQQGVQYISQNMFDKIAITKNIPDIGIAELGYDKVNFTQEELISSASLPAIERSIATRYFDEYYGSPTAYRLAFAQRRTGLFWKGTLDQVPGLYYSAAFTNGIQSNINYTNIGGMNKFGGWAGAGYKGTLGDSFSFDAGLDLGYSGDGNSQNGGGVGAAGQKNQSNSTWGYNPYINLGYGDFKILAEFFQANFENGRSTIPYTSTLLANSGFTSTAMPYGFNIIPTYQVSKTVQLAGRFTYLSTNGRGTDQNGVLWNGPNDLVNGLSGAGASTVGGYGPLFDDAYAFYIGVNWDISPGVRISAGDEYARFTGRQVYTDAIGTSSFNGPSTNENLIRIRLQLAF